MKVNIKILIGALLLVSTFVANRCVAAACDIAQRAEQYRNYRYPMAALGKEAQKERFARSAALRAANKEKLRAKKRPPVAVEAGSTLAELLSKYQEVPVVAPVAFPAAGGQLARLLTQGCAPAGVASGWSSVPAVSFGDAGGAGTGFKASVVLAKANEPIVTMNPSFGALLRRTQAEKAAVVGVEAPARRPTPPRAGTPVGTPAGYPAIYPAIGEPAVSNTYLLSHLRPDALFADGVEQTSSFVGDSRGLVGEPRLYPPVFGRITFEGSAASNTEEALSHP